MAPPACDSASTRPLVVGEQAHGLRAARVDAQYVHRERVKYGTFGTFDGVRPQSIPQPIRRAGIPLRVASAVLIVAAAHRSDFGCQRDVCARVLDIAVGDRLDRRHSARGVVSCVERIRRSDRAAANRCAKRFGLLRRPDRTCCARRAQRGSAAHLSVSVNVAAAVGEFPASREHVIYQHPEWLMVPRQLAAEMLKVDVQEPRVSRTDLAMDACQPDARRRRVHLASRSGSGARIWSVRSSLPSDAIPRMASSSRLSTSRARTSTTAGTRWICSERACARSCRWPSGHDSTRSKRSIPSPIAEEFPDEWRQFRESALTDLVEQLRSALRASHPALTVAVGARADADASQREHFQAWRSWLERGIVDRIGYRSRSTGTVLLSPDGVFALGARAPVERTGRGRRRPTVGRAVAPAFAAARGLLERAVADRAFPAAVVEVGTAHQPLWREAFGHLSFAPCRCCDPRRHLFRSRVADEGPRDDAARHANHRARRARSRRSGFDCTSRHGAITIRVSPSRSAICWLTAAACRRTCRSFVSMPDVSRSSRRFATLHSPTSRARPRSTATSDSCYSGSSSKTSLPFQSSSTR